MKRIFDMDAPVMNVLNKITNLMVLNLCFLASCIPVFTIGAGLTALYSVNLKMVRNEEAYVFGGFWRAWREGFVQSTKVWLAALLLGVIFAADYRLLSVLPDAAAGAFRGVLLIFLVLYGVTLAYVFPYIARFQDRTLTCVKNALIIGVANPGYTVAILLVAGACAAASFLTTVEVFLRLLFIWIVIGFSLISFVQCFFLRRVFRRYEEKAASPSAPPEAP